MDRQSLTQSRWTRRAAWLVGGVLALWGIGWLAVPPLLRHQAQKLATEKLGRAVTIGAVDFKPWSMELTVSDLAIASADGRAEQLHVKRIYLDAELQSVLRWAPVVDAVQVDQPVLRLTHLGGGHYDIDDVLHRLAPAPDQPAGEPAKFALYNLALNAGSIDYTDTTVGRTHAVRELRLVVPFLSNLPSKREVTTEPLLAFKLGGSVFNSSGQTTPFAQTHKTDATLRLEALDLAPYLDYIPASLPVRLQAAVLDANVKIAFEENPEPAVRLSGVVQASRVKLADARNQDLLAFDSLKLSLADVRPLARSAKLSALELSAPRLLVHRAHGGQVNLLDLASSQGKAGAPGASAEQPAPAASAAMAPASKRAPVAWALDVAQVSVRQGRVDWTDDTTAQGQRAPARLSLRELSVDASGIGLPLTRAGAAPIPFKGSGALTAGESPASPGSASQRVVVPVAAAALEFTGSASAHTAALTAAINDLPLSLAAPYVAQWIEPALDGNANAALQLSWQAAAEAGAADQLKATVQRLSLEQLTLKRARTPLASVRSVELSDAVVDLTGQSAVLGKVTVEGPKVAIERDHDGRWMFETWLKDGLAAPTPPRPIAKPAGQANASAIDPWKLAINELTLSGGALGWHDDAGPRPVALELSALRLALQHFALDGKKPAALQIAGRVAAGHTEAGRLSYRGTLGLNPLAVQGAVEVVDLPLHALEPYFAEALNVELLRADTSFKGMVRYQDGPAGPRVQVNGDSAIEDLRVHSMPLAQQADKVAAPVAPATVKALAKGGPGPAAAKQAAGSSLGLGEELLSWKALSLRGLELALAPGSATTVKVKETALSDFFARVLIQEDGRINLQDLVKATPAASAPAASVGSASATSATSAASAPASAAVATAPAAATPAAVIEFGPVSLINGSVNFSDHFVQPNYTANLTEVTGKLSAFSSVPVNGVPQLADLELRGRAEGTASLEVLGKLNPLAKPLALDIKGKVRDLELPPLSPYSVKYAGHGIERGKLSVDVSYLVLPNGQLTASNQIILNQLSFGEAVPGAPASLPVRLAVALLADRNGVIDINLPISGSLNDPQFRLGPIIFKVIVNLIVKAITSPFTLLASAFGGGGDELSAVNFAPGSAVLTPEATQSLDKVAKALADRPALKMTVLGTAALETEREGYKRERLQALLRAEKRRALVVGGTAADASVQVSVSASEYPELLKAVYKRADIPKPRNFVGMAKDIAQPEMEALLLANIQVTEELMRELATQRGVVVRDYLASRQLPLERLFLGAPRASAGPAAAAAAAASAAAAPWRPRAELQLSTR